MQDEIRLKEIEQEKQSIRKESKEQMLKDLTTFLISLFLMLVGMLCVIPSQGTFVVRFFSIFMVVVVVYSIYQYITQFIALLEYRSIKERKRMRRLLNEENKIEYKLALKELRRDDIIE